MYKTRLFLALTLAVVPSAVALADESVKKQLLGTWKLESVREDEETKRMLFRPRYVANMTLTFGQDVMVAKAGGEKGGIFEAPCELDETVSPPQLRFCDEDRRDVLARYLVEIKGDSLRLGLPGGSGERCPRTFEDKHCLQINFTRVKPEMSVEEAKAALQGIWRVTSASRKCEKQHRSEDVTFVFRGNQLIRELELSDGEKEVEADTFTLDHAAFPMRVTFYRKDGKVFGGGCGIYELKGGRLRLCVGAYYPESLTDEHCVKMELSRVKSERLRR
jgi:uncharacterized protein (TIGR03067 family)